MRRVAALLLAVLVVLGVPGVARAHESQPATLEIRQIAEDRYEVVWRAPTYFGRPHPARLELPADWTPVVSPVARALSDSDVVRGVVSARTIDGSVVRFPGLEGTITDVFVRIQRLDGTTTTVIARPTSPTAELRGERAWYVTAGEYAALGVHHILLGVDHLLFVLGLLLIVSGRAALVKTVTAFTVAHSVTLALATLGWASVPLPPLNAAIALSILFLGPEIVRTWRGETSLTIRRPWLVAFLFGLLHGFGFASGLSTTGMPRSELAPALLFFNVGVEAGQLAFVGAALALAKSFRVLEVRWPRWAAALPGYTVGSLGAYWTVERTFVLLGGLR